MKHLLCALLLLIGRATPVFAIPPTKTIDVVYVLLGGNPASNPPITALSKDYGADPTADANTRIGWLNGDWRSISWNQWATPAVLGTMHGYVTIPVDAPAPGGQCSQGVVSGEVSKILGPIPAGHIRWHFMPNGLGVCGNSTPSFPGGFVSHEFGHSNGYAHEHDWIVNGTSISTPDYGSRSVMGGQGTNLGAEYKDATNGNFFSATYSLATVRSADGPKDVFLTAYDVVSPGIKAVKIVVTTMSTCGIFSPPGCVPTPVDSPQYYVEFRPGRQGGSNEVLIHKVGGYLMDLDPGSPTRFGMLVGEQICYPAPANVCIKLVGYGPEPTAQVHISFGASTPAPINHVR